MAGEYAHIRTHACTGLRVNRSGFETRAWDVEAEKSAEVGRRERAGAGVLRGLGWCGYSLSCRSRAAIEIQYDVQTTWR